MVIRELEAYYAKNHCLLFRCILSYTAGYLTLKMWAHSSLVPVYCGFKRHRKGWQQVLIDASIDLMDSCDKCTNQRNSGYQFFAQSFCFLYPNSQL